MAGNIWEWCSSLHWPYPYQKDDGREALEGQGDRVLRGGTFLSEHSLVRCTSRYKRLPNSRDRTIGFRVVLTPSGVPPRL